MTQIQKIVVHNGTKTLTLNAEKNEREWNISIPKSVNILRKDVETGQTIADQITDKLEKITDYKLTYLKTEDDDGKIIIVCGVNDCMYPCYDISHGLSKEQITTLGSMNLLDKVYCPTNDIYCTKSVGCKCNRNNW